MTDFGRACRYQYDGSGRVLSEDGLLIDWHGSPPFIYSVHKYDSRLFIALDGIIFIVNNFEKEISIPEEELNLIRVYLLQSLDYILNRLVALADFISSHLQD